MKRIVGILVALLLILLVLWRVDYKYLLEYLHAIDKKIIALLCLIQLVTLLLINLQWKSIAKQVGENIKLHDMISINMSGKFVECVTPSAKAGGEAVKVYLLKKKLEISSGKAAAIVSIHKSISMTVFVIVNIVSIIWFLTTVRTETTYVSTLFVSLFILITALILLISFMLYPTKASKLFSFFLSEKGKLKIEYAATSFRDTVGMVIAKKRALVFQLLLSLLIWSLFAFKAVILANSLELEISFIAVSVVTYLSYMIAVVPLLPGGVGTFETGMVFLLVPLGIAFHQGMALALALRFVTFWFVFLLSIMYIGVDKLQTVIFTKRRKRENKLLKQTS
ncbi:MAG: lysylphosphatidylglycerol synthase transmembrane domain-containing protein [Alkaliphilus sp.]